MTARAPSSFARLMAIVIPRSLKEPVGLAPSTLRWTSQPVRSESTCAGTSGVPPSRRVTTGVFSVTGSRSRYSSMTPRHWRVPDIRGAVLPGLAVVAVISLIPLRPA